MLTHDANHVQSSGIQFWDDCVITQDHPAVSRGCCLCSCCVAAWQVSTAAQITPLLVWARVVQPMLLVNGIHDNCCVHWMYTIQSMCTSIKHVALWMCNLLWSHTCSCVGNQDSCLVACRSLLWLQITSFAAIATLAPGRHRPEQCTYKSSVSHCQLCTTSEWVWFAVL